MSFFPQFPIHLNVISLFGLTLLFGLLGGELARRIRFLPRISGYIALGFLLGPGGFKLISVPALMSDRIFIDIPLGLILFDLGRQLDFTWLRHDRGLLLSSLAESSLTFIAIFLLLYFFANLPILPSALAASFAIATSPAVVMMVAHDLSSEGPVTRRSLMLTSLNNFFALTTFTFLAAQSSHLKATRLWLHAGYLLLGSLILGLAMFVIILFIANFIGKKK